ncbi:UNVERIFIED_CONTAM: Kinesin-like protein KIN-7I [Sesamum calycinum]|uniref:Kinesin-like protein KIN-7I n=1 Tax=Sesamum calycinum TaxID=2727403 RepID=A0AAW2SSZ5_9LAMI
MERIHISVRARPLSAEDAKASPWCISGNSIVIPNQPSKFEFGKKGSYLVPWKSFEEETEGGKKKRHLVPWKSFKEETEGERTMSDVQIDNLTRKLAEADLVVDDKCGECSAKKIPILRHIRPETEVEGIGCYSCDQAASGEGLQLSFIA